MQKEIFPIIGNEKELPFYVVGIGIECWQYPVNRTGGYEYPQLLWQERARARSLWAAIPQDNPRHCIFYPRRLPTRISLHLRIVDIGLGVLQRNLCCEYAGTVEP